MGKRIAVIGAGAVGGYTGGHMARNGIDVTFIDPWPEHVEAMRSGGLRLRGLTSQESFDVPVKAMNLTKKAGKDGKQRLELWALSVPASGGGLPSLKKYVVHRLGM